MTETNPFALLRRLVREQGGRHAPQYALAFACMMIFAGCTSLSAWLMKDVVNDVFVKQNNAALLWLPAVIVTIFVVKGAAAYLQEVILARVGNRIVAETQKRMFDHLLKMDVSFFHSHPSNELITRIAHNAGAVRDMLNVAALSVGRDLFTLVGLVIVMVTQEPLLAVLCLLIGPIVSIGLRKLIEKVRIAARREILSSGEVVRTVQETTQGIKVVKIFALEPRQRQRMYQAIEAIERTANRITNIQARVNPMIESLGGIAVAAVVFYAGWRSIQYGETPGRFFAFITALLMAADPARRLSRVRLQLTATAVGVGSMYELLDQPASQIETEAGAEFAIRTGEIKLRNVDFHYAPGNPVLKDLSLTAAGGKVTALVGLSGSGKSTIINLLARFWDPVRGSVSIDGQDLRDVKVGSVRRNIAVVSQDVFLFDGTIEENIAAGTGSTSHDAIVAAARAANAHDFIMALPQQYATQVGELGANLSGGQRQRISIARAFLKNAPIILLDEPTSALDSESERAIQSSLGNLMKNRTTVVIAHRLATVQHADVIHIIESGCLVESGTHDQLLRIGGIYSRLCALQFGLQSTPKIDEVPKLAS